MARDAQGNKKKQAIQAKGRHVLRTIAIISAACGIFLNIIAIVIIADARYFGPPKLVVGFAFAPLLASFLWNLVHLTSENVPKQTVCQIFGDALAFSAFLVILVSNGVLVDRVARNAHLNINKVMCLTYNTFPWIICATMHLCLFMYPVLATLMAKVNSSRLPKIRIEWPAKPTGINAQSTANNEDRYNYDVEAPRPKRELAEHQGDEEENEPLLSIT